MLNSATIIFKDEKLKAFPPNYEQYKNTHNSSLLFNIFFELLMTAIKVEKVKLIQTDKKEVKLSLFADNMIVYI